MSKATAEQVRAAIEGAEAQAANVADFGDAQRRRHLAGYKTQRQTISDDDLMFESLCDLFGFNAEERAGLHLFVARSMDKSPDDRLVVNEVDLGRQLDGDKDVTNEAFKRRTCRLFDRIDDRQREARRMVLDRIPGHFVMG